jgi:hypothetical protein
MENDELRKAGHDLVAGYKASGLNMSDIAAILTFALEAVVRDPQTSPEAVKLLASMNL